MTKYSRQVEVLAAGVPVWGVMNPHEKGLLVAQFAENIAKSLRVRSRPMRARNCRACCGFDLRHKYILYFRARFSH